MVPHRPSEASHDAPPRRAAPRALPQGPSQIHNRSTILTPRAAPQGPSPASNDVQPYRAAPIRARPKKSLPHGLAPRACPTGHPHQRLAPPCRAAPRALPQGPFQIHNRSTIRTPRAAPQGPSPASNDVQPYRAAQIRARPKKSLPHGLAPRAIHTSGSPHRPTGHARTQVLDS